MGAKEQPGAWHSDEDGVSMLNAHRENQARGSRVNAEAGETVRPQGNCVSVFEDQEEKTQVVDRSGWTRCALPQ